MARNTKPGENCTYCSAKATTRDHVPPRCLFPKPMPPDLVTVPCCKDCNQKASLDDEYFRTALAMRDDLYERPEVQPLAEKALKSFARPERQGLAKRILGTAKQVDMFSNGGIY